MRNSNASLIQCSKLVFEGVSNLRINKSYNESNFTQINVQKCFKYDHTFKITYQEILKYNLYINSIK